MAKLRLAIASPSFSRHPELRRLITTALPHWHITFWSGPDELRDQDLAAFLSGAEAIIVGKERIDTRLLQELPELRVLAKYGVGLDRIDLDACAQHGVKVYYQAGVNAAAVAEHTIGLMLAMRRRICTSFQRLQQGLWIKDGGDQLSGSTVAIIGCGAVGTKLAHLLHAFDCPLLLCDILPKAELAAAVRGKQVDLLTALAEASMISLHVPLTIDTHHLINAQTLSHCRPTAMLVNTSRGEVVDFAALHAALRHGRLGGAALDVFANEPHIDPRLLLLPQLVNFVATPHTAGNAKEAVLAMGKAAISGLLEYALLKN